MKSNKKILIILGIVVSIAVGGAAGCSKKNSGGDGDQKYVETAGKSYDEAKKENVEEAENPYESKIDFEGLTARNPDIYAWIKIPGTNVDYPILQNPDESNDYYLNRTMDGEIGLPGSIYTEKHNTTGFDDPVTVIYGHTLHDGTMFSELEKYTDETFFKENPYIYIHLPGGKKVFQIFSAVAFDDRYLMGSYAFTYEEDFNQYIADLKACLEGNTDDSIAVNFGTSVITLSTCIDEYPDKRWLVSAVQVDEEWY